MSAVLFVPGRQTLVSAGGDGSVRLWNIDPAALSRTACADPTNQITSQEWDDSFHDLPYAPPCS